MSPSDDLAAQSVRFINYKGASGQGAADLFGLSNVAVVPSTPSPSHSRVLTSGNIGLRDDGTFPTSLDEEIEQLFRNVTKALQSAGLGEQPWQHVYRARFFVLGNNHFAIFDAVNAMSKRVLGDAKPVITALVVPAILHPDAHVEMEVEAWLSSGSKL